MPAMRNRCGKCDGPSSASECDGSSSSSAPKLSPPLDYDVNFPDRLNDNSFATLHPSSRMHASRNSTSSAASTESNSQESKKNNKRTRPKTSPLDHSERDQQQGTERVPRPRNAFIIFRSWYIGRVKAGIDMDGGKNDIDDAIVEKMITTGSTRPSHSINHQNELSKRAAKAWNGMNLEERRPYVEEAKREKEWHRLMYPDYVYAPGGVGVKTGGKGKEGTTQHARREKSSKLAESDQAQASGIREKEIDAFERKARKGEEVNVLGVQPLMDLTTQYQHQQGKEGDMQPPFTKTEAMRSSEGDQIQCCDNDAKLKEEPKLPEQGFAVDLGPRMSGCYGNEADDFPVNPAELYAWSGLHDSFLGMTGEFPANFSALQVQGARPGDTMSAPLEYWPLVSQDDCEALQASLETLLGNSKFDQTAFTGTDTDFYGAAFPGFFTSSSEEQRDDKPNCGTEYVSNTSFLNSSFGNSTVNFQHEQGFELIDKGFLTTDASAQMPIPKPASVWNVALALDRCMHLEMDLNAQVPCNFGVVDLTYIGGECNQDPGVAVEDRNGWRLDTGVGSYF